MSKKTREDELKEVKVLGVKINPLSKKDFLKKIVYFLKDNNQHYVVTTNPEFLMTAMHDNEFKRILNLSDLSLADGSGVIWADYFMNLPVEVSGEFSPAKRSVYRKRKIRNQAVFSLLVNLFYPKKTRVNIPERLSGADLIFSICELLAKNDHSLYLLGGQGKTPVSAKFELERQFPDLLISGIKGGFSKEKILDEELVEAVNKAKPDVVFVALGHPFQEKWIFRNLDKMPSVKLAIGVGGALDFIGGSRRRAPLWLRKINLEWLFRLIQEPNRLNRIKTAVWEFPRTVCQEKIKISG